MKVQVLVGNDVYEVELDDSMTRHASASSKPLALPLTPSIQSLVPHVPLSGLNESGDDKKFCRSPLAGIVARVLIQEGQDLQPGDVMLVLEAMKMETKLTSPGSLKSKSVKVAPGDVVKPQQVLIEFE